MVKSLQINLFSMSEPRVRMCFPNLRELSKVTTANLSIFKVKVYTIPNLLNKWEEVVDELTQLGVDISISPLLTDNYMARTRDALNTESQYSCRLDDDIFMSSHVWDFLLSNIHKLEDQSVGAITPILTAGIPTVDYFILDFLDNTAITEIYKIFKQDNILRSCWGIDYSNLYNNIEAMPNWNPDVFYAELANHSTPFKGVHPIRFSDNASIFISQYVVDNFDRFMSKHKYHMDPMKGVHNTHPFVFRTDTWKQSLEQMYDDFDELSLNVYMLTRNMTTYIIRNGYAIHMAYGCIPSQQYIEDAYYNCIETLKQE